ncbi:hypothetical protein MMC22_006475 [Lobaria immixta]|nr:hypothetical protein [Lobaria immixta]
MAPILPILVRQLLVPNSTKLLSDHLSGDHHALVHDSAVYSGMEIGCAESKCPSKAIGIPGFISALIHSRVAAGNSVSGESSPSFTLFSSSTTLATKRSWLESAVSKVQSRGPGPHGEDEMGPWQVFGNSLVVFLLFVAGLIVLSALVYLVASRLREILSEYQEFRKAEEAKKWSVPTRRAARSDGDTNPLLPARAISNNDFFTIPEDVEIGIASVPPNGVVDDEDLERGRPLRRFLRCDPRNPQTGLASSSTADGKNKRNESRISSWDNSEESNADVDLMRARTERHWRLLRSMGSSSSSSQSQQQQTSNAAMHGESIPMVDLGPTASSKAATLENEDGQVPREIWQSTSGRQFRSITLYEETSSLVWEGENRRNRTLGTSDGRCRALSRNEFDVSSSPQARERW